MPTNLDHNSPRATSLADRLTLGQRWAVLLTAFIGLVFAGVGLGLMPVASLSISQSFLGTEYDKQAGFVWLARYTASMMLGAACGGILLGQLGDRIGRTRALGVSVLIYSLFAGAGALVTSQEQLLVLRFIAGLGVGGMWPNGAALVAECFSGASRPVVSGVAGAGMNVGILLFSQIARLWPIQPDSWRWVFVWSMLPALLGLAALVVVPESPRWLASRVVRHTGGGRIHELFRPPLLRMTLVGLALAAIPLVGAWAASKWMLPWAGTVGGSGHSATTQGYWATGATLGGFCGAPLASWLGRRLSYFLISLCTTALTCGLFLFTTPLDPIFLPWVFVQGFVATLFFGWLPLCLPEFFPTHLRATGSGIAYNTGRFATAAGVLTAILLIEAFDGDYAKVGAVTGLVYGLGMIAIWWVPTTRETMLVD